MTTNTEKSDAFWMRRALQQARRGWGRTSPNPLVGAVVVKGNQEIGRGYHHCAGGNHAEALALAEAGSQAEEAELYVTLEPCSTTGRTSPCTERLIKSGVRRVVIGTLDPNPKHYMQGVVTLRRNNIRVTTGVEMEKCCLLNEAYFCWTEHQRPFVMLKMAMTLDGRIATASGASKWITGEKARSKVQKLRQWADAIMVGGETVRQDDPSLTVREPKNWSCQPLKFVWTRSDNIPEDHQIFQSSDHAPRFVHPQTNLEWNDFLRELGQDNILGLLLEGGGELAAAALEAEAVDKIAFFIAPKILGGQNSRPVVGGTDPKSLQEAYTLFDVSYERIGQDILIKGYPDYVHRTH